MYLKRGAFAVLLSLTVNVSEAFVPTTTSSTQSWRQQRPLSMAKTKSDPVPTDEVDVVVIGSGLAGLSCAALLSHCGKRTTVVESHDAPGGAAHSWERRGFHFESGPSLYSGFSMDESPNPLKNIFQIIGEDAEWITYDRWGTVMPDGRKFAAKIGPEEFGDILKEHGGPHAEEEFAALMERMAPLSNAAQSLTSLALREDAGAVLTLLKYPKELFTTLMQGQALNEPFSEIMEEMQLKDKFVKNWLDML
jgi:phytoene dehydrogenase-like protein